MGKHARVGQGGDSIAAAVVPRDLQEFNETVERSRLGGPFYVIAWLIGGVSAGLATRAPLMLALVALGFAALTLTRLSVHRADADTAARDVRHRLDRLWTIILLNSILWGAASGWLVLGARAEDARMVMAVSSFAFSTACAHNFCMRRQRALAAIALLYLPTMAAFIAVGARAFVVVGLLYLLYVVLVLRRSHREYLQRLDLEDELRRQRDLFEQQSQRDGLTGLANRRRFATVLDGWVDEARAAPLPFVLMIFDLDWFKAVNDRHGHAVGDATLRAFAHQLQAAFSTADDVVARLGGEEFAVLTRDCAVTVALQRAEEFRETLAGRPLPIAGLALGLTVSIGVGGFEPRRHVDGDALYQAVDKALYQAKASGRNTVRQAEVVE